MKRKKHEVRSPAGVLYQLGLTGQTLVNGEGRTQHWQIAMMMRQVPPCVHCGEDRDNYALFCDDSLYGKFAVKIPICSTCYTIKTFAETVGPFIAAGQVP